MDYRQLNDDYKDLDEADEIKKRGDKLQRAINSLMDTIQRIQAPNMKVQYFHITSPLDSNVAALHPHFSISYALLSWYHGFVSYFSGHAKIGSGS